MVALKDEEDWISLGKGLMLQIKEDFFLLDFEVLSSSNHRQHKILA